MDCDIHAYVEYREKTVNHKDKWHSLTRRLVLSRNLELFESFAGNRLEQSFSSPKGLPEDLSKCAYNDWWTLIDKDTPFTQEYAKNLQEHFNCQVQYSSVGEITRVEEPDFHSATWLSYEEFKEALNKNPLSVDYEAVLAMMNSLENNNQESRIVMWFDN